MATTNSPKQYPGLPSPEILEEVLQRIHDNVYSRSLLSDQTNLLSDFSNQNDSLLLPQLPLDLIEKITLIRNAQAPYYVMSGNLLAKIIKRLHNLVLKLFGRKQAYFNSLTLDLLESMAAYLHAVQGHSKAQASRIEFLARQVMFQTEHLAALQMEYQQVVTGIEQLTIKQDEWQELKEQINQLTLKQNDKQ